MAATLFVWLDNVVQSRRVYLLPGDAAVQPRLTAPLVFSCTRHRTAPQALDSRRATDLCPLEVIPRPCYRPARRQRDIHVPQVADLVRLTQIFNETEMRK
jgi:hypothetical protein